MFYALFKLFRAHKKGQFKDGMGEFAHEQAGEILLAPFWLAIIILAPFLIFCATLGFFEVWGGPYGLAKFFFWFFGVIVAIIGLVMRGISKGAKKILNKAGDHLNS